MKTSSLRTLFPLAAAALEQRARLDVVVAVVAGMDGRGEILPLARILQIVQREQPGDVIEVELERDDGRWEYDVKVLTADGIVRKVTLAARDGAVLKVRDDD